MIISAVEYLSDIETVASSILASSTIYNLCNTLMLLNNMMNDIIEKQFVVDFFKDQPTGKFLEIGACDGGPNSDDEPFWGLLEKGWNGVYCEPNPMSCTRLINNVMPYGDKVKIFNGAVAPTSGLTDFYLSVDTGGSSSFDPSWMSQQYYYKQTDRQYPIITNTTTVNTLLNLIGWDVDAISIDVEAKPESEFLKMLFNDVDLTKLTRCKLFIIEAVPNVLRDRLLDLGFEMVFSKVHNSIFYKK